MNIILSKELFKEQTRHFSPKLLDLRSWILNELQYPIIDITFLNPTRASFRVRIKCENYDELPCSFEFLDSNGEYLIKIPRGSGVINHGNHPTTKKPFVCSPGSLEYHTHPNHVADLWENYRGKSGFDIGGMITQIHNAWLKTKDIP